MATVPSPHVRPGYRQVADDLRRRIAAGLIPPGALLPSESTLMQQHGVARGTVRDAVAQLRAEGLVITERGRGTYVRPVLPVRRLGSDRYRRQIAQLAGAAPPESPFTADQGVGWSALELDRVFAEVPADDELAVLFGVEPGTTLLERRFLFRTHGVPQQMSVSILPLDLVAGTPVADPDREPWPGGTIAQMHTLGLTVTGIREVVRARMPSTQEATALHISAGVPVVVITRQMYAGDRVVEVAHNITIPADRVALEYWIDLTGL